MSVAAVDTASRSEIGIVDTVSRSAGDRAEIQPVASPTGSLEWSYVEDAYRFAGLDFDDRDRKAIMQWWALYGHMPSFPLSRRRQLLRAFVEGRIDAVKSKMSAVS